jgi:hypothetical protein
MVYYNGATAAHVAYIHEVPGSNPGCSTVKFFTNYRQFSDYIASNLQFMNREFKLGGSSIG